MNEDGDIKGYLEALGLSEGASLEDVKRAYRVKAAEYHPDKVSHLGEKLRALADLEMRRINEAYHALTAYYAAGGGSQRTRSAGCAKDPAAEAAQPADAGEAMPVRKRLTFGKALKAPLRVFLGLGAAGIALVLFLGPLTHKPDQGAGEAADTDKAVYSPTPGSPAPYGPSAPLGTFPSVVACCFCEDVGSGCPDDIKKLEGGLYHQPGTKKRLYFYSTYNEALPGRTVARVKWYKEGREIKRAKRVLGYKGGHIWFWIDGDFEPGVYSASITLDGSQLGNTKEIEVLCLKDRPAQYVEKPGREAGFRGYTTATD